MYCEVCGIPQGISKGNVWYSGGTIAGRYPPYIKGTFFDADELNYLFRSLSEYLDYDISDIVASGKYHDAREYMSAMVGKMKEASGGKLPPDEELYRMMLTPICIWGIARVEFADMQPDKMVIDVKDPYSVPLLCGDVAGVADVVTGRENVAVWKGGEREGAIVVTPDQGHAAAAERVDEASGYDVQTDSEELACERCEACGAPREVSRLFAWEREVCRIEERSSGRRYCFNNTRGISVVLAVLAGELGEDIEEKMVDMAREYSRSLYEAMGDGLEQEYEMESYPYRGWGKFEEIPAIGGKLSFGLLNPYNEVLVAGRIWGMLEAAAGDALRLAHRSREGDTLRLAFERS